MRTVLVVEDDERLLATLASTLERTGQVTALAAASVGAARELAARHRPDACIVDYQLGTESGIDLIRELRRNDPKVRLVLVTGYGSMETGAQAVRAGADHVLQKPIGLSEIMQRISGEVPAEPPADTASLDRAIWEHMQRVLADCGGNRSEAARRLRIDRGRLQRWLDRPAPK